MRQLDKHKIFFSGLLMALFLSQVGFGGPHEEVLIIEQLIETTQKNLYSQQDLLKKLNAYNDALDAFVAEPTSGKKAARLVKTAMRLQIHLNQEHLSHLFSQEFLNELTFFNQVGKEHFAGRS